MAYTTIKYRIKDATTKKHLNKQASAVNFIWNYCNEMSGKRYDYNRTFLSGFDLNRLCTGCSRELGVLCETVESVGQQYALKRIKAKKIKLRWRSHKRSTGWIPFKRSIRLVSDGKLKFNGRIYRFWQTRPLPGAIRCGSFTRDNKGRWFVNLTVKIEVAEKVLRLENSVGVDLGLTTTATYSTGEKFTGSKSTGKYAQKLAIFQRANKKSSCKKIHSKIANTRCDALHKETSRIITKHDTIFIGDVSSKKLAKTKFAKSVLDASWGLYRTMLEYKAKRLGKTVVHVKENQSTVTCSGCLEKTFPGGLSTLGVREWTCSHCGSKHDRDINAARNILRVGLHTLSGESKLEEVNSEIDRLSNSRDNSIPHLKN